MAVISPADLGLPVVLLSHRGPITFARAGGQRTASRGSGGLVSALQGLARTLDDAVWVCAAASEEDTAVAAEAEGAAVRIEMSTPPRLVGEDDTTSAPSMHVRMVTADPAAHDAFYTVIANPLLWFLQHGLYGLGDEPDLTARERNAFRDGYVAVNATFADAVAEEVERHGGKA